MTQITILDHVEHADKTTSEVRAIITADGCGLCLVADAVIVNVTWEQMADVEYLSTLFADTTVRVFKVVVQLLGRIYSGKDAYKLLV